MSDINKFAISVLKDVVIALLILGIILGSLYVYSGRWPPMVVIESPSMSHGPGNPPESKVGVIDAGDLVIVKEVDKENIITYVEGKSIDHKTYGQYGDVIIYRPENSSVHTPIIHRPILYLELNETSYGVSFDIPSLDNLEYGVSWKTSHGNRWWNLTGEITILDYGYKNVEVKIKLSNLLNLPEQYIHSGYITMGDNNLSPTQGRYDQAHLNHVRSPIREEWVVGKAKGEIPWYGSIKLLAMGNTEHIARNTWINLIASLIIIIGLPFLIEELVLYYNKKKTKREKEEVHLEYTFDQEDE